MDTNETFKENMEDSPYEGFRLNFLNVVMRAPGIMGSCYTKEEWVELLGEESTDKLEILVQQAGSSFKKASTELDLSKIELEEREFTTFLNTGQTCTSTPKMKSSCPPTNVLKELHPSNVPAEDFSNSPKVKATRSSTHKQVHPYGTGEVFKKPTDIRKALLKGRLSK